MKKFFKRGLTILSFCMMCVLPIFLSGCSAENEVSIRVEDEYIQWQVDGSDSWNNLIAVDELLDSLGDTIKGDPGIDGREVEFQVAYDLVLWRYVTSDNSDEWKRLIPLSSLKGNQGEKGEKGDKGEDAVIEEYVVKFDYVGLEKCFVITPKQKTIRHNTWILDLPKVYSEFSEDFDGWYIKGSDKKIEDYSFIGSNITLEARWKDLPAGVYDTHSRSLIYAWQELLDNGIIEINEHFCRLGKINENLINIDEVYEYSLVIDDSIAGIGDLGKCFRLTSISIPASVSYIDVLSSTAYNLDGLVNISVDENNTVFDSRNDCNAVIETSTNTLILGCVNTTIPYGVSSIGKYAFSGLLFLTSIKIPSSVKSIENSAFSGCQSLNNITLSKGLESIGERAFNLCTSLESIEIPEGVLSIGDSAFRCCYRITTLQIPASVSSIGKRAFSWCDRLQSINVSEDNSVYDSRNDCNAIIETSTNTLIQGCLSTIISDSILIIGEYSFEDIFNITSFVIPNSVKKICKGAFCVSEGLGVICQEIIFIGTQEEWEMIEIDARNEDLINGRTTIKFEPKV